MNDYDYYDEYDDSKMKLVAKKVSDNELISANIATKEDGPFYDPEGYDDWAAGVGHSPGRRFHLHPDGGANFLFGRRRGGNRPGFFQAEEQAHGPFVPRLVRAGSHEHRGNAPRPFVSS